MASAVHGVLVVDKPRGPTSHDVVQWARRALETREVGHAGTLDPMATGVLVLAVGEGTKLVPYLTADDKEYEAELLLGVATDTLDAEGTETARAAVPPLERAAVVGILERFLGPQLQRPPVFSAIKVGGTPLHERARRGEAVEAAERAVDVRAIELLALQPTRLVFRVRSSKGFYVRSLGRDLATALGTVGHLVALRRTASGAFVEGHALSGELLRSARDGDPEARNAARGALRTLEAAVASLRRVDLDVVAEAHARAGRRIRGADARVPEGTPLAMLSETSGLLVAIGERIADDLVVRRGFTARSSTAAR